MKKDKLPLVTAVSSFDAVVLCDGDYPSHAVALSILQHAKYLVCCDGAGMHYILHGGRLLARSVRLRTFPLYLALAVT